MKLKTNDGVACRYRLNFKIYNDIEARTNEYLKLRLSLLPNMDFKIGWHYTQVFFGMLPVRNKILFKLFDYDL